MLFYSCLHWNTQITINNFYFDLYITISVNHLLFSDSRRVVWRPKHALPSNFWDRLLYSCVRALFVEAKCERWKSRKCKMAPESSLVFEALCQPAVLHPLSQQSAKIMHSRSLFLYFMRKHHINKQVCLYQVHFVHKILSVLTRKTNWTMTPFRVIFVLI